MNRHVFSLLIALAGLSAIAGVVPAQDTPATPATAPTSQRSHVQSGAMITPEYARQIYEQVTPSLVAVQFTWEYEYGKADFVEPGVVVSEDGLILVPGGELLPRIPLSQLKDFKIIIPRLDKDNDELEGELVGVDGRADVCFARAKEKRAWKPVKFENVAVREGEPLVSVGLVSRDAGYRSFLNEAIVGAHSRGEMPMIVATGGGLAGVGAPVFNSAGQAVGWVNHYLGQQFLLHTTIARRGQEIDPMQAINNPPHLFVPTSAFEQSLNDPPTGGQPVKLAWLGTPNMTGLNKDVAQVYGLEEQPTVELGDVVPGSPADKAGLKVGMKITRMNGQPLERGDLPEELPGILGRKIIRMKPGTKVNFTVLTEKDQPTKEYTVTLGERPKDNTQAKRYWAEDLGFGVRELVWEDTYERKQPQDMKG